MFTGIISAVGEVRECRAIGEGRDMRLVIGVPARASAAPGVAGAREAAGAPGTWAASRGSVVPGRDAGKADGLALDARGPGSPASATLGFDGQASDGHASDGHASDARALVAQASDAWAVGASGVMRAGELLFLPAVSVPEAGDGAAQAGACVGVLRRLLGAEGAGLEALVRLGMAVVGPEGVAGPTGAGFEAVRRALAAELAGGPVPGMVAVAGLPGGALVQVEAVAWVPGGVGASGPGTGGFLAGVALGASIACSGCCLTVVEFGADWFAVEASAETLSLTTLGRWAAGTRVNLERALRMGDELGGHMVSGHVDGLGEMVSRREENGSVRMEFALPAGLARFVATKGSIAVDGVSLTVNSVREGGREKGREGGREGAGAGGNGSVFGVNVIPHTAEATTLGLRRPGDAVHIEVDGVARNAARLAQREW